MATDPAVTAALEEAVRLAPDSTPLRRHLVSLLLETGRFADALHHATQLLARNPDDAEALRLVTDAAATVRAADGAALATNEPHPPPDSAPTESGGQPQRSRLRVIRGGATPDVAVDVDKERTTLADVAGMAHVKRRLELAFLAPMRSPDLRRMYGKKLRGGLLLYGPPGCGKTFIAKAVAGELGAGFISIGLTDVLNMWLGESERQLHEIFEKARKSAPCVLFFDEVDALGRKRSLMRGASERTVVNQLLAELDSAGPQNEGVFVLAATNHPWDVDGALRRPGRLDRTLLVLPPDSEARGAIVRAQLAGRPVQDVDATALAGETEGFSGADLVHLCDAAAELAIEQSIATGTPRAITMADFGRALRDVRPSTRAWFSTARNYAEFANEGGVFDDLIEYLRAHNIR